MVDTYEIYPLSLMDPSSFDVVESPFETFAGIMRREQDFFDSAIRSLRGSRLGLFSSSAVSPRYEVLDRPDKFQVMVDVPEGTTKPNDVDVTFDERSNMLTVTGKQESHNEDSGYHFSSQFSRSFSLDPSVEVDQMAATMDGGVLTISAPKNAAKAANYSPVRSIPVTTLLDIEDTEKERMELPAPSTTPVKVTASEKAKPAVYASGGGASDPFHVKERIEKARAHRTSQAHSTSATDSNPNDVLVNPATKTYKTSELRRRR